MKAGVSAMKKRKKRSKHLSVLIIPDDDSDPLTFKISFQMVKILGVVAVVLIIHILTGTIFYYKFSVTNRYRQQLERENINLKDDNRKINQLYDTVEDFIQFNSRLRSALGVDQGFEISDRKKSQYMNTFRRNIDMISESEVNGNAPAKQSVSLGNKGSVNFLTRSKSSYHQFASNIPTYLPVEGLLTIDFRRGDWYLPNHLGIDIAASRGSGVHAAADGVVIFANWTEHLGNLIILYHFNGFFTYYGHNQVLLKKENCFVKKGDTIALVGSSGRSTAPHLHFEIWKDGVPVDPKEYLLAFQNK
jgi:murein DD-endopeptidase MepM/ murein hydrolase activator NlpD